VAGTVRDCKVYLNNKLIHIKDFKAYVAMYANAAAAVAAANGNALVGAAADGSTTGAKPAITYERFGDRWEVAFAVSDGQFQQVSFVNAIATTKGGTHVDHVSKQLVEGLVDIVKKKNKNAPVKPHQVCAAAERCRPSSHPRDHRSRTTSGSLSTA
jgi:DNA topoisomerase-2